MSSITLERMFVFDVKNPRYSWSPMSSATNPNGPFSPFVSTIHIGDMLVPSQLITSADAGGCGASSGLIKLPIIHAFEIFDKISRYLSSTYLYLASVSNVANSGVSCFSA